MVHRAGRTGTRVVLGTALALALTASGLAASPARAATPTPAQAAVASLAAQDLSWVECYPGAGHPDFECAALTVPRDWRTPAGGTITVAVSRVKAGDADARRGVLFTNPGGPGGSGLTLSLFIAQNEPAVAAVYDVIGIDPRGVGSSAPSLRCADPAILGALYDLDGRNVSAANQRRFTDLNRQYATVCAKSPLTRSVTTDQTARDLDLLRAVLGESRISYLGYSAGTWLGTWYAALFPQRVDRFVLDGNLDFTAPEYESAARQPAGFQTSFEKYFLPWVAANDATYGLGASTAQVKKVYDARRARLARTPLTLADGSRLTASGYDSGITGGLYWTGLYPATAAAMAALEHYDTANDADKQRVLDTFTLAAGQGDDVFWAVSCQDDTPPTARRVLADTNRFRTRYPLLGAGWNVLPCMYWPGRPVGSPVRGAALPPMLMLNNAADPATPLANAVAARSRTPRAVLVTVRGQPDHTIYAGGDQCVEDLANAWLVDGVLPARDTSCPGLPLPDPTNGAATQAPPQLDPDAGAGAGGGGTGAPARAGTGAVSRGGAAVAGSAGVWMARFAATHGPARIR